MIRLLRWWISVRHSKEFDILLTMEGGDMQNKIDEMDAKLNAIYKSVEKTRKYFLITMWVTLGAFVIPAIGLVFVIPQFLQTYATIGGIQ